jgi:hypothetical protein
MRYPSPAGIFLDIFNVFPIMLELFGGVKGADR